MSKETTNSYELPSIFIYPIGIFGVVGMGVGLTAAVLMSMLGGEGGAIILGILSLVVVAVSLLLGPVVASVAGIQMSKRKGGMGPLGSAVGCSVGFLVMMGAVLIMLFLGIAVAGTGGGGGASGSQMTTATSSGSDSGFDVMQYVIPTLLVAIPTGLTGGVTHFLHAQSVFTGDRSEDSSIGAAISLNKPMKYVIIGIVVTLLLTGGVYSLGELANSPADNLEVDGVAYSQGSILYTDATVSNPGENRVETELTVRLKVDGEEKEPFTTTGSLAVEPGDSVDMTLELGSASELSSSDLDEMSQGNYVIEFVINGEVKDTYTES